jgi:hypothetical protein
MKLFVKTPSDETVTLNVGYRESIISMKQKIQEILGIPPIHQKIMFAGISLKDERTLYQYAIQTETTFYLIIHSKRKYKKIFHKNLNFRSKEKFRISFLLYFLTIHSRVQKNIKRRPM